MFREDAEDTSVREVKEHVREGREKVSRLEKAGEAERADRVRVRIACRLWRLARRNDDRGGGAVRRFAIQWGRKQLAGVDPDHLRTGTETAATVEESEGEAAEPVAQPREPERRLDALEGEEIRGALEGIVDRIELRLAYPDLPAFEGSHANLGNVLLHGPPGTGKSHGAEAVARELGERGHEFAFVPTKGADIKDHRYGGSEENLARLLEAADEDGPAVVFVDEFDEVASREKHDATGAIATTLTQLTEGPAAVGDVVLIAATNLPGAVDAAIWDRFVPVEIPEPPVAVKRRILARFLGDRATFGRSELDRLDDDLLDALSPRGLRKGAQNAFMTAWNRGREPPRVDIGMVDDGLRRQRDRGRSRTATEAPVADD